MAVSCAPKGANLLRRWCRADRARWRCGSRWARQRYPGVREHLIESALLPLAAVPAALLVAWGGLKMMTANMPPKIARFVAGWYQMDVDGRLVIFTVGLSLATALIFGLMPAFQASRPRLGETLKEGGRSATVGGGRMRLRRALVVAEMSLALPLLLASALSVLTVQRFLNGPQGYEPDRLLAMRLDLASGRYPDAAAYRRFALDAVERLRHLPIEGRRCDQRHSVRLQHHVRAIGIEDGESRSGQRAAVAYRVPLLRCLSRCCAFRSFAAWLHHAVREGGHPVSIVT